MSQILRDSVWHVRFTHLNSDAWLWFFFFLFIENAGRGGQQPPTNQAVIIIRLRRALTYYFKKKLLFHLSRTKLPTCFDAVLLFFTNATPETSDTHTHKGRKGIRCKPGLDHDTRSRRERDWVFQLPANHPLSRRGNERDWRHLSPLSFSLYYSYDLWRRFTQTHAPPTNKKNGGGSSVSRRRRDGGHF